MIHNKTEEKVQLDKISNMLLLRMFLIIIMYTVLGIAAFFLAYSIYMQLTFQTDDPLYKIVQWLKYRISIIAFFYLLIGYCAIIIYYWKKPFQFLIELQDGAGKIYEHDDTLITLSPSLKHFEAKMNQLKMSVHNSERAAREAEQRKNELVAYLAHDLKTPITSVIGYLTLLTDEKQISDELRERYLSISLDKATRLDELINEFFEITRFNLSHITLEYEHINLTRMLEQLIYEFKPMLAEKNLDCILTAPPDVMLYCDADKIQRVFDNLLRNAKTYSFENSSIQINVTVLKKQLTLSFENKGNTISKEKLNRLFEQFFRLDTSRSSKSGGVGLGLAIAKEITELHHGSISAFSENECIRFDVTLPVS